MILQEAPETAPRGVADPDILIAHTEADIAHIESVVEAPITLLSVNTLAEFRSKNGDYEKAEPLFKRAVEGQEKVLGKNHPDLLTSLNSLAEHYLRRGREADARPLMQRVVNTRTQILGKTHPDTLASAKTLAGISTKQMEQAKPARSEIRKSGVPFK